MDIKRTILIVALAIVSYVMVLKWNQDYGQAALPTPPPRLYRIRLLVTMLPPVPMYPARIPIPAPLPKLR